MKKMLFLFFAVLMLTSCAKWHNRVKADGGVFGTYSGDWIVVKQSGGHITDVFKLNNVMVQSEAGSDGWLFVDESGNPIHIGGDMKAIRVNKNKEGIFSKYIEYHMEFDSLSYQQRFILTKK